MKMCKPQKCVAASQFESNNNNKKKKEVDVYKRGKRGAWNDKTRNEGEGWRKELSPTHEPLVQKKKTVCEAENKMQGRERKSPPVFSENTFGPGKYRESVDALFSFFF